MGRDYKATQPPLYAALGTGPQIEYPLCSKCKKSDAVREVSPEMVGSSWTCLRCRRNWCQSW